MIKIVDLYAGIGGIRLGFEQAFGKKNVDCVFTCEIDKYAAITYITNFDHENLYTDIKKIPAKNIPDHDILLAGFPCQPFSEAGLKRGFEDKRGDAFFVIENILKAKKSCIFLLENVPNLKTINNGENFELIQEHLKNLGYKINYSILTGKDFGVPQNRRRLYIVGYLDHDKNFEFPKPINKKMYLKDILENNVSPDYCLSDKRWGHIQATRTRDSTAFGGYKIWSGNEGCCIALKARYEGFPETLLIKNDKGNPRMLTERECARLQGFPDSFVISKVSRSQAYKQLGNSVCVPVIKSIAKQIKKTFFSDGEAL